MYYNYIILTLLHSTVTVVEGEKRPIQIIIFLSLSQNVATLQAFYEDLTLYIT